jgi:tetrahydromethanopterin S-methyltransferase subunit F
MQLYPNPANDMVYIHAPDDVSSIDKITIVDLQGRVILVKKNPSLDAGVSEIDVSGISNGIYQVRITSGKTTKNLKLIVNKFSIK